MVSIIKIKLKEVSKAGAEKNFIRLRHLYKYNNIIIEHDKSRLAAIKNIFF